MTSSFVLISGASSGIGRATALQLAREGVHVLAGVRRMSDGEALVAEWTRAGGSRGDITPLQLDVTSVESIQGAVGTASQMIGQSGLRAVINNAGIVVPGPVEHVSAEDWRRQFDVNFFGIIELTRATLPLLRRAVAAYGYGVPRLLFVSSIGGRVAQPILAPYTSSKFAATALGDSLRLELRRQGIGVTVIEPGAVATAIWAKGDTAADEFGPDHPARVLYGAEIDGLVRAAKNAAGRATPAGKAAEAIVKSVFARRAPARLLVGTDAKVMALLKNWLPVAWFDEILAREFGIAGARRVKRDRPVSRREVASKL